MKRRMSLTLLAGLVLVLSCVVAGITATASLGDPGDDVVGTCANQNDPSIVSYFGKLTEGETVYTNYAGSPLPTFGDLVNDPVYAVGKTSFSGSYPVTVRLTNCSKSEESTSAIVRPPDMAFACYGLGGVGAPGVWYTTETAVFSDSDTYAPGYWAPYAAPGNVEGGTNIGDYHLICYLPAGMETTGSLIDDGGVSVGAPGDTARPGTYRVVA